MSKLWRTSNIDHKIRIELGLSLAEYCYLDLIYKSQNHKDFSKGDYAKVSYAHAARNLGMTKSAIHKMTDRLSENTNFIEVDPSNPQLKKVTPDFYNYAYTYGGGKSERQPEKGVEKVNGTVEKVHGGVEKVNDNRGKSERHTKYKTNSNLNNKTHNNAREETETSIPKNPKKEPQKNSAKKVPLTKDDLNEQITEAGEEILRVFKKVFPGFQNSARDYDNRMRLAYTLRDYLAETSGKDPTLDEMVALLEKMLNNPPDYWESQPTPKSVYNNFNHFTSALKIKKKKKNGKSIKEAYELRNKRRGIKTG